LRTSPHFPTETQLDIPGWLYFLEKKRAPGKAKVSFLNPKTLSALSILDGYRSITPFVD
jgi:hypothetical protein